MGTARLGKPCKPHPELDRLLKEASERFAAMTPEEQESELRKQRMSWARQDMD